MKQEEILQYNKMCAEFLGWEIVENEILTVPDDCKVKPQIYFPAYQNLLFHSDWNWIMEVVEAIEKLKLPSPSIIPIRVQIEEKSCRIFKGTWNDSKEGFISVVSYKGNKVQYSKKEAVINAINQFLIWYEQNKII